MVETIYHRPAQPSPNFPQPIRSLVVPPDLDCANSVEGWYAFNRARARLLIRRTVKTLEAA
ncbi:MAG: hypothetical protein H6881_08160 [Rhodobiaceae bacterium]|nr:hypothetical protein [Rhodobiaceae bacterium]MCC0051836.1 hypothetical protein [Rhodobiaceae bacterium]